VDLMHSFAALVGRELPADAGPDSFNVLPALLGESKAGRDTLVEQGGGVQTAMRKGQWKFIPQGAAAPAAQRSAAAAQRAEAQAVAPAPARSASPEVNNGPVIDRPDNAGGPVLYDLANDLGERKNVAGEHPEVVKALRGLLRQAKEAERTRP
jgi:hypothetical protein